MVSMSHTAPNKFEIDARARLLKSYVSEHCLEDLTPQEALCEALEDPQFVAQVANMTSYLLEETILTDDGLDTQLPQDAVLLTDEDVERSAQLVCDAVTRAGELELLEGDPTVPDGAPIFDEEVLAKPEEPPVPTRVQMRNVWKAIKTCVQLQWAAHDERLAKERLKAKAEAKRRELAGKRGDERLREANRNMKERYFGRNGVYVLPR